MEFPNKTSVAKGGKRWHQLSNLGCKNEIGDCDDEMFWHEISDFRCHHSDFISSPSLTFLNVYVNRGAPQ
jgi:hypothetical protein